jgi:hypothetical protein
MDEAALAALTDAQQHQQRLILEAEALGVAERDAALAQVEREAAAAALQVSAP